MHLLELVMPGRLFAVAFALFAPVLHAALHYRVEAKSSAVAEVTLCAQRIDGDATPIVQTVAVPSSSDLAVGDGTWELRVESQTLWAAPAYARDSEVATLEVIPASLLTARFANARELPKSVRLRMTPQDDERFRADVDCVVRDGAMHCVVPAGRYDVRISPKQFAPQFLWGVDLVAGRSTVLDPISLSKGASVIGSVTSATRTPLPQDTRVELVPVNAEREDGSAATFTARPNARGFFELTSVPPGEYVLTAAAPSLTSDRRTIVVVADRTAELNVPLLLDTPKRVRVTVVPPRDPSGKPWLIELARERAPHLYAKVGAGSVDADGAWEQKRLPDGDYEVSVLRRDGASRWASQVFHVEGADADLFLTVPGDRVEGKVVFGDRPIAARLSFGGEYGVVRQLVETDEQGEFSGVLPPGKDDRWDIFVEADTPPTRHTLVGVKGRRDAEGTLHFEIALPRTVVMGTVVDPEGTAVEDAIVNLSRADGTGAIDQTMTATDGSFQFSGIGAGRYRVTAEDHLVQSDVTELEMGETETPMLRLVLKKIQLLQGRVITNESLPVIGTSVLAIAWNSGPPWQHYEDRSNDAGAFTLRIPPADTQLDLLIAPPGFATMMTRMPVRTGVELRVLADQHGGSLVADIPVDPLVMLAHGGAKLWLSHVTAHGRGSVAAGSGGRQRVSIPSLQAGDYELCLRGACVSGYVPPHGTLHLTLD